MYMYRRRTRRLPAKKGCEMRLAKILKAVAAAHRRNLAQAREIDMPAYGWLAGGSVK
jgi:hypothetical protein